MSSFGCASGHTEELALLPLLGKWCKQDLSPGDVNMIMKECDNETNLLRWESTGNAEYPATGGSGQWWINQSKVLSLPELLYWAHDKMTMYELYSMWIRYPIFATKKKHSESNSEHAVMVRNSKQLRFAEEGIRGLNAPPRDPSGPPRGRQRR